MAAEPTRSQRADMTVTGGTSGIDCSRSPSTWWKGHKGPHRSRYRIVHRFRSIGPPHVLAALPTYADSLLPSAAPPACPLRSSPPTKTHRPGTERLPVGQHSRRYYGSTWRNWAACCADQGHVALSAAPATVSPTSRSAASRAPQPQPSAWPVPPSAQLTVTRAPTIPPAMMASAGCSRGRGAKLQAVAVGRRTAQSRMTAPRSSQLPASRAAPARSTFGTSNGATAAVRRGKLHAYPPAPYVLHGPPLCGAGSNPNLYRGTRDLSADVSGAVARPW